jgi:CubicO group peptidase (beta-lactamase class C family)
MTTLTPTEWLAMLKRIVLVLGLLLAAGLASWACAQPPGDTAAPAPGWAQSWADGFVRSGVDHGRTRFAVVTVVDRSHVLINEAFGTDAAGRPVSAVTDQVAIASVSKTFTAAAIAQLMDRGVIASLDDPANRYLKRIQLPSRDGRQVTLRELLTHSAGFEERNIGFAASGRTTIPAAPAYIRSVVPALVRTPGTRIVYANIDPAILGMVIEDVTGQTLQAYLAQHIFAPLGMTHTILNYRSDGGPDLVRLPRPQGAAMGPIGLNAPFFAPTGSVQTTGADMALYLQAMLGARPDVITPTMLARLTTPLMQNAPATAPLGMAWFLDRWNGTVVADHSGGGFGFASYAAVVPSRGVAMFIDWGYAPAREGARPFDYGEVLDGFLHAALGDYRPPRLLADQSGLNRYVGRYWTERRPHTDAEVIEALAGVQVVTLRADGLYVDGKGPFHQIAPNVIALDTHGDVRPTTYVLAGDQLLGTSAYSVRVHGLSDPAVVSTIGLVAILVLATGLLGLVWCSGWTRWTSGAVGLAALAFPLAIFWSGLNGLGLGGDLQFGHLWRLKLLWVAGAVIVAGAASLSLAAIATWRRPSAGALAWVRRVHLAVLALAALVMIPVLMFIHVFTWVNFG